MKWPWPLSTNVTRGALPRPSSRIMKKSKAMKAGRTNSNRSTDDHDERSVESEHLRLAIVYELTVKEVLKLVKGAEDLEMWERNVVGKDIERAAPYICLEQWRARA
jgi:hypothetical protein